MALSLKQLLLCVAVVACGLTALVIADKPYVTSLVRFATMAVLVIVAYGIWTSDGAHCAFRVGFLAWACVYYLIHVVWDIEDLKFGTGSLLGLLLRIFHPSAYARPDELGPVYFPFCLIGHCLLTLIFGLIGGWVTVYFYRKRQRLLEQRS